MDDLSSVATAGGSSAGSVSGVSSKWSRPNSRTSNFSYTSNGSTFSVLGTRKELKRTWYSQENWGHGGLRLEFLFEQDLIALMSKPIALF